MHPEHQSTAQQVEAIKADFERHAAAPPLERVADALDQAAAELDRPADKLPAVSQ
jgi:hypothetical protein